MDKLLKREGPVRKQCAHSSATPSMCSNGGGSRGRRTPRGGDGLAGIRNIKVNLVKRLAGKAGAGGGMGEEGGSEEEGERKEGPEWKKKSDG